MKSLEVREADKCNSVSESSGDGDKATVLSIRSCSTTSSVGRLYQAVRRDSSGELKHDRKKSNGKRINI